MDNDGLRRRNSTTLEERTQRHRLVEEEDESLHTVRRSPTVDGDNRSSSESTTNDIDARVEGQQPNQDNNDQRHAYPETTTTATAPSAAPGHNPTGPVDANSRLHRDDERFIDMLNENTLQWRTLLSTMMGFLSSRIRVVLSHTPGLNVHITGSGNGPVPVFEANAAFSNDWTEREIPEELANPNPTQIHQVRQRLFRTIFTKIVLLFVITFPARVRKLFEYSLLTAAIFSLFMLTYLHVVFVRRPRNCLEGIQENWTTDGILRLEILSRAEQQFREAKERLTLEKDISFKFDIETTSMTGQKEQEQVEQQDSNSKMSGEKSQASSSRVEFTNEAAPAAHSNVFGQIASALFDYSFPFTKTNSKHEEINNHDHHINDNKNNSNNNHVDHDSDANVTQRTRLSDEEELTIGTREEDEKNSKTEVGEAKLGQLSTRESKDDRKKAAQYFQKLAELEKLHKSRKHCANRHWSA